EATAMNDFFISYSNKDRKWAEWIAEQLRQDRRSVILQAWNFHHGQSFIAEMDQAIRESKRTIAVLSQDYLDSKYCQMEWQAVLKKDVTGALLVILQVGACEPEGLLAPLARTDLIGLDEERAREALLSAIAGTTGPL